MGLFYVTVLQFFFQGEGSWGLVVLLRFLRGVLGKTGFSRGVLVVNLWWNASLWWTYDTMLCGA
jgi:hypothetical protein